MAKDTPSLATQRVRRMLTDMKEGPFVVLAFPEGDSQNLRVYASGLSPEKMRRIEQFVDAVINE